MTADATTPTPTRASDEERLARATISLVAEPGDVRLNGVTRELGGVTALDLLRTVGHTRDELRAAAERLRQVEPERELERAVSRGLRFVVPGDDEWPAQLDDLTETGTLQERGGAPIGLWVHGPMRLDRLVGSVAVVGSRSSTTYGDQVAADLAAQVGSTGRPIVSGGAFGIDYAAHRGALSLGGPTVAVLASGADRPYPAAHRAMLRHLAEHHAVISEAPPGASPMRVRFLARNRLIAALARGTVVVEAAVRSGALNTANWAQMLSRVVMGTPGPITSAASVGVHHLVRSGGATLVTSGADVLELLDPAGTSLREEPRGPVHPRDQLRLVERQVLDAVPVVDLAATESVARVAGVDLADTVRALGRLEEVGLVEQVLDGWRLTARARG